MFSKIATFCFLYIYIYVCESMSNEISGKDSFNSFDYINPAYN